MCWPIPAPWAPEKPPLRWAWPGAWAAAIGSPAPPLPWCRNTAARCRSATSIFTASPGWMTCMPPASSTTWTAPVCWPWNGASGSPMPCRREPSTSALSRWKTIAAASPFPPPPAMTGWLPCPLGGATPCRAKIGLGGVAALDRRKPGCAGRKPAFGRFWPIPDFSGAARSPCPLNH